MFRSLCDTVGHRQAVEHVATYYFNTVNYWFTIVEKTTFESQVGLTVDAILQEWRQWLANQSGLPYDPLPADSRSLLYDVALPTIADSHWVIKGVADLKNPFANWQTDMRVFNSGASPEVATLTFYPLGNAGTPLTTTMSVNAGEV